MSAAKTSTAKQDNLIQKVLSADLKSWNTYLAVLFALQGIVILVLSVSRSYPVSTSFLGVDTLQSQAQGHTIYATGTQHLIDINIVILIALFLFIAAITHGLQATKLRSAYDQGVNRGINKIRWIEYSLSAGLMMVLIGLLVGVQDISTIIMLFGATAVMCLLGLIMEAQNQGARKVSWLSYIIGCGVGILPWIVLTVYLISGGLYGVAAPAYVYWVFGSMLLLFGAFAGNLFKLYRKSGKWKDYKFGEQVFMILSLAAKTALAWLVFAGSLHP